MPPEATIAKPPAAPPALTRPWVMTPLFCAPPGTDPDVTRARPPGRRAAASPRRTSRRATARPAGGRANHGRETGKTGPATGKPGPAKETADLLAVTAERLGRALSRSFLRYSIPGDLDAAVHAALNVIEPVLEARDSEIRRLRGLMAAKIPAR
jgi:hypothetical protein